MNEDRMWDFLVDFELATKNEIQLVTKINGWNTESFESILYVRTGYRSFTQYIECEMSDYELT